MTSFDIISEVKNAGLHIAESILMIQQGNIELFSILPFSYLKTPSTLLFLCDNFQQLQNNILWVKLRFNKKDLIIDANGNVKFLYTIIDCT